MKRDEISEIIRNYLVENARRGGKTGGKSQSEAKQKAVRKNLELARQKRWPKKEK